jgi:nucleoside-triphosphatase
MHKLHSLTAPLKSTPLDEIWLITGPPGIGKSTVVSRVVLRLKSAGIIVGGCVASERRQKGARVGFDVKDLTNGTQGELASLTRTLGPKVGKYRLNLADLASVGAKGLLDAAVASELIVIDEVGPMELVSPEFRRAIHTCLLSGKPILAVVHERLEDDLLVNLRAEAKEIIVLSQNNRNEVADRLSTEILGVIRTPKAW